MDSVLRAAAIYLFLLVLFRIAGKRTLSEATTFDFLLLLIIGEATQQALLGEDFSLTNAFLVILTLIGIDIAMSLWEQRWPRLGKWFEGVPLVIVDHGQPLRERMQRVRVNEEEILTAARERQGLSRMDQIQYAVLERSGGISIIPRQASSYLGFSVSTRLALPEGTRIAQGGAVRSKLCEGVIRGDLTILQV